MSEQPLRYVALGDSLSEGVGDDPWPDGTPRGWTDRLAELMVAAHGEVQYANLAVRGLKADQILDQQVDDGVSLTPQVMTLTSGMNDIIRPKVDWELLRRRLIATVQPFTERGARVVVVPIPDVSRVSWLGRMLGQRRLRLNAIYQELHDRYGMESLTDTTDSIFEDARAWADDRLHLSPLGHQRLAMAAAETLGIPGGSDWNAPAEAPVAPGGWRTEVVWLRAYAGPWVGRRLRGRSSADGRVAKRPMIGPFDVTERGSAG